MGGKGIAEAIWEVEKNQSMGKLPRQVQDPVQKNE